MFLFKHIKIRSYEMGLYFRDGEFKGLLAAGRHWFFDPLGKVQVEVVSQREPWLVHEKLDVIVKSGALEDRAVVLDLKDYERALVWIDGRFSHVLPPGLYAYWTALRDVRVEVVDARKVRFEHEDFQVIVRSARGDQRARHLHGRAATTSACCSSTATTSRRCRRAEYAFWKNMAQVKVVAGGPARGDARRRRPGHHDGRQGHAAPERRGHLPRRRRPAGGQRCRTTCGRRCTARRSWRCGPWSAPASSTRS